MKEIYLISKSFHKKDRLALIDDEDFEQLSKYSWTFIKGRTTHYAITKYEPKIKMHNLLVCPPYGFTVDHADRNGLNNQRNNLRIATATEQSHNRRKELSEHSSRYKGVSFRGSTEKWVARITVNGVVLPLGNFTNEKMAAFAYNEAAIKYFGEFARINEIWR